MSQTITPFSFAKRIPTTPSIGSTTVTKPDHVHLSFGFAAPHLFPIEQLSQAAADAVTLHGRKALQYSGSGGPGQILSWIQARSKVHGIHAELDQILVTYGSTQGIDLATRILVDPGDHVWVESPSFFSALQAFRTAEAVITSFPIDDEGVRVDLIENALLDARQNNKPIPKFLYTMPTYHNPGGVTLSLERRKRLAQLAEIYNFFILEDDAYSELNFTGNTYPPLYTLYPERVIYLNTFSKIIAPGLRLGWIIADSSVIAKIRLLSLGGSIGVFTQEIVAKLLSGFAFQEHVDSLIDHYRNQRDIMAKAVRESFGEHVSFHLPEGGFYIWLRFPDHVNTSDFLQDAADRGVSFVDGKSFYVNPEGFHYARLCFSYVSEAEIVRGVRSLADAYFAYIYKSNSSNTSNTSSNNTSSNKNNPKIPTVLAAQEDIRTSDSEQLIKELSVELGRLYESDGTAGFQASDVEVPRAAFIVARLDGHPVGCGALRPIDETTVEVKRMYTRPDFRRKGVAQAILSEAERLATQFGYTSIKLQTGPKQPEAAALYERVGYYRVPIYSGNWDLVLAYQKDLNS
ncbi:aminotransferase class I/II-fold pyridoxal phosphate-dependent enzyme [Paenibacillus sp. HWE-109]|uniref:aminotransferase class I/II-fold pyridoxal phosphate-dependent enzyme n=1 Tax=Paenibacillus sp. HWE-109 TaxID=1306526 RepID=UPI001EDCF7BB|nr:aminotransferase class I/II-fold pyridoxal phosphate-dependent enzyme [Paenibacillus sp. HWE-109]UKS28800.1 aminotransferase class I/II-fold pyridoxal phosphate-dependent enzyme [Paenibacillus sp. HWE-109]